MTDRTEAAKRALRARMREARDAVPFEERAALSARAGRRLLGLAGIRAARTILVFYAFGSEIPMARIAAGLHDAGKRLLLPYVDGASMEAAEIRPDDELVSTDYGPKEPARRVAADPAEVDAVVAPGLAFDRRGHRLGYGAGHYDRYLRRLRPDARRIGIGFELQVVEEVPTDPGDEPLDVIVTDAFTIETTVRGRGPSL